MALFPQPDGSDADAAAQRAQMSWAYSGIAFAAPAATVTLTGTVIDATPTEADIVAGGKTVIITVTNDTFLTFDDTIRQAVIDGLDSDGVELLGWNNEVRDKEVVGAVVRDSATQVTVTLSAAAAYDITADETITVTVPASALTGGVAVVATPTFDVTVVAEETAGTGGGWLPEKEILRLKRIAQEARKRDEENRELEIAKRQELRDTLRRAYNEINGIVEEVPEAVEEQIAMAVAEVTPVTRVETRLPIFDFDALVGNAEALARVAETLQAILEEQDEEEAVMAMLLVVA